MCRIYVYTEMLPRLTFANNKIENFLWRIFVFHLKRRPSNIQNCSYAFGFYGGSKIIEFELGFGSLAISNLDMFR